VEQQGLVTGTHRSLLSGFLKAHQDEIVAIWTDRARQIASAAKVSNLGIIDDLPRILAGIADAVAAEDPTRLLAFEAGPTAHAVDRLGRGYDLDEVIREYALLRLVILDLWKSRVGQAIDVTETMILDRAIDHVIEQSSVRFSEARHRMLSALDSISDAGPRARGVQAFLQELLDITLRSMEAVDTAVVFLREDGHLRARAAVGLGHELVDRLTVEMGAGFAGRVGASGKPQALTDIAAISGIEREAFRARNVRGIYGVPLSRGDDVVGVACVGSTRASEFSDDDRLLFRTMARRAADVIVEARLQERERRARDAADRMAHDLELRDQEFRVLADNIPQLAWMADENGSLFWFNQRWFDYTGTTLDEVKGSGWTRLHHPDHEERVTRKSRTSLEKGEPWEDTFPLRGRDGSYRWFLSRASPIRDPGGRVVRWFGTNTDVTSEREALRQRDEILAVVSHDLRGPLGTLLISVAVLEDSLDEAQVSGVRKQLDGIQRSARRMQDLIEDLLDLANIRAGHLTVAPRDELIDDVVEEAVEAHAALAASKGIALHLEIEAVRGVHARADRGRLLQVLGNLLGNAVKFCRAGDQITIEASRGPEEIVIVVQDSGPGIPEPDLARIFDPYWSGQGETRKSTGLGLYISQGIIQAHGGRIWAESKLGHGTKVTFTLPAR